MRNINIGIIGMGNMGKCLTNLMTRNGFGRLYFSDIIKYDEYPIRSNREVIDRSDMLFLCVKPCHIREVLNEIEDNGDNNKTIVSTVAGVPIKYIESRLESEYYPIIRCMPNLPVSLGLGNIIYVRNENVNENVNNHFREIVNGPFMSELLSEQVLDFTTVLSGSMPAFLSLFVKKYRDVGIANNISEGLALRLLTESMIGTGKLLLKEKPEKIIKKVSSKEGVTEIGIGELLNSDINNILSRSVYNSTYQLNKIKENLD